MLVAAFCFYPLASTYPSLIAKSSDQELFPSMIFYRADHSGALIFVVSLVCGHTSLKSDEMFLG